MSAERRLRGGPVENGAIGFHAPADVLAALDGIGRTEDLALSPDGSRVALAAFSAQRVHVFSLAIARDATGVSLQLPAFVSLSCDRFRQPHGCAFLDGDHLLVCNRGGGVVVVRVPEPGVGGHDAEVAAEATVGGRGHLPAVVKTPGSAAVHPLGGRRFRAFVCSDQWHFVTSHVISLDPRPAIANEGIRIEKTLQIPDGIAISPDRKWIAVSNHVQGRVQLFRYTPDLARHTPPDAVLGGSVCPHGLSFDGQGSLYVADAASPYVHRYARPEGDWTDLDAPTASFRVLDERDFHRGRYAAREGGVKGIHVEQENDVMLTTHKLGVLEFHDLRLLRGSGEQADPRLMAGLRRERDAEIERTKSDVLQRKWSWPDRLRADLDSVSTTAMDHVRLVAPYLNRRRLRHQNLRRSASMLDPAGPVVSMTSHSLRIAHAHIAIESIAEGKLRPRRCVLWLPEEAARGALPDSLRRLQARGLEIRFTPDLGPHTKYFPYIASASHFDAPLVTADDDIVYPRHWLAALAEAAGRDPTVIHCHRARRMRLVDGHFSPYGSWAPVSDTRPHRLNFAVGASGVIYPPAFLAALKARGRGFLECCPTADDIWLNRTAQRDGYPVAQIARDWPQFHEIPPSQAINLFGVNVGEGGNQLQLDATYTWEERAAL